ncbi:MAG: 2-isopropylmalate synthase [Clostridia bacterium]|nr:2-isopropylmalate synthase [Clostridia bacterium]
MQKKTIEINKKTNLLEEGYYKYPLQDVKKPQLFRDVFDYKHVPKIIFNNTVVPMGMPKEIWLTDTTFRDGQQSMSPFTVKQMVDLFKLMSRLGGKKGIVRQSEFFLYSEKDRKAAAACRDLGLQFPEVTSWIRANKKDFQLVKEMEIKETGILVSCSDYHIFKKMNLTRSQAMDKYLGTVKDALDAGIRPRCHFEDITRADFYGFVIPFATELMRLMEESGIPIKIRACDTMGFGVNFSGAAIPRSVQGIIYGLKHYARVPSALLEWHGHNDFYKVVTNADTAWLYGCAAINCSLLGVGERTGNCPLEAMAIEYASFKGTDDGMDFTAISDIAEYFEKEIGYSIPPRTPFVGKSFNSTRAGIHADGMLKSEEIYNVFDTKKILNRPMSVAINNTSGLAGIAYWINQHFELKRSDKISKTHAVVEKMKERIDKEYADGRCTVMSDEELVAMLSAEDPDLYKILSAKHRKV